MVKKYTVDNMEFSFRKEILVSFDPKLEKLKLWYRLSKPPYEIESTEIIKEEDVTEEIRWEAAQAMQRINFPYAAYKVLYSLELKDD